MAIVKYLYDQHYVYCDLKDVMKAINDGFDTVKVVTSITKYIPKIGSAVNILQHTVQLAKRSLDRAYKRVKEIDDGLAPYAPYIGNLSKAADEGE